MRRPVVGLVACVVGVGSGFHISQQQRGIAGRQQAVRAAARLQADVCERLQDHVDLCNAIPDSLELLPLVCDGQELGSVVAGLAKELANAGDAFVVEAGAVALAPALRSADRAARSAAVARVTRELAARGVVTGWRDELVPVVATFDDEPAFLVERAAYPLLGCKGYGVHVNGYVEDGDTGALRGIWVGTRAATKQTYPSLLDHLAAGQQPFGIAPGANVVKEAGEEAGVPEHLAARARPAGAVSYRGVNGEGRGERVTNDVIFCYDLPLPVDFVPAPVDGEIDAFDLISRSFPTRFG